MSEEIRTTSSTGGQKGVKPERHSLLPKAGLDAIARVFGFGASKYAAHNWRRGYEWEKSFDALIRHVLSANDGETYDPESGEPHLAHAGFHILVLLTWLAEQGEGADNPFDSRWPAGMERMRREADEIEWPDGSRPVTLSDPADVLDEVDDVTLSEDSDDRTGPDFTWVSVYPPKNCREALLQATQRLREAFVNSDEHPEDPHGADEIEYAQDWVDQAVKDYEDYGPDAEVPIHPIGPGWVDVGYIDEAQDWAPLIRQIDESIAELLRKGRIPDAFTGGGSTADFGDYGKSWIEDYDFGQALRDASRSQTVNFDVALSPAVARILFGVDEAAPRHFVAGPQETVETFDAEVVWGEPALPTLAARGEAADGYVGEYRDMLRKHAPKI